MRSCLILKSKKTAGGGGAGVMVHTLNLPLVWRQRQVDLGEFKAIGSTGQVPGNLYNETLEGVGLGMSLSSRLLVFQPEAQSSIPQHQLNNYQLKNISQLLLATV